MPFLLAGVADDTNIKCWGYSVLIVFQPASRTKLWMEAAAARFVQPARAHRGVQTAFAKASATIATSMWAASCKSAPTTRQIKQFGIFYPFSIQVALVAMVAQSLVTESWMRSG